MCDCLLKSKETLQQISPSINVLLFKLVELGRNKNVESNMIGY